LHTKVGVCNEIASSEKIVRRPSLSIRALISFIASFIIARMFTILNPSTVVLVGEEIHVHHFWYGIALLAIGGWLGISYDDERIDRLAAILFGAGGGLIADEVGLLLKFTDYWTELTYTLVMIFVALVSIMILIIRYSRTILREFFEFSSSNTSLYIGVFLEAVSVAFIMETDDLIINIVSSIVAIVALMFILAYFIQRIGVKHQKTEKP
jgi:hypothetical protein